MFLIIETTKRSGYHPKRPNESPHNRELPAPLALVYVLFSRNIMARYARLCRADPGPPQGRHDAIGLCPVLHRVDLPLLLVEPARGL